MGHKLLVVCVGNICRSPMGEAVFARALGEAWTVESAGLGALVGHGAAPEALVSLAARGYVLEGHVARQIDEPLLRGCDLVLVMETRHKESLEARYPWMCGRIFRLGHWEKFDIEDPYRRPQEMFDRSLSLIEAACASWVPRLQAM